MGSLDHLIGGRPGTPCPLELVPRTYPMHPLRSRPEDPGRVPFSPQVSSGSPHAADCCDVGSSASTPSSMGPPQVEH